MCMRLCASSALSVPQWFRLHTSVTWLPSVMNRSVAVCHLPFCRMTNKYTYTYIVVKPVYGVQSRNNWKIARDWCVNVSLFLLPSISVRTHGPTRWAVGTKQTGSRKQSVAFCVAKKNEPEKNEKKIKVNRFYAMRSTMVDVWCFGRFCARNIHFCLNYMW